MTGKCRKLVLHAAASLLLFILLSSIFLHKQAAKALPSLAYREDDKSQLCLTPTSYWSSIFYIFFMHSPEVASLYKIFKADSTTQIRTNKHINSPC